MNHSNTRVAQAAPFRLRSANRGPPRTQLGPVIVSPTTCFAKHAERAHMADKIVAASTKPPHRCRDALWVRRSRRRGLRSGERDTASPTQQVTRFGQYTRGVGTDVKLSSRLIQRNSPGSQRRCSSFGAAFGLGARAPTVDLAGGRKGASLHPGSDSLETWCAGDLGGRHLVACRSRIQSETTQGLTAPAPGSASGIHCA